MQNKFFFLILWDILTVKDFLIFRNINFTFPKLGIITTLFSQACHFRLYFYPLRLVVGEGVLVIGSVCLSVTFFLHDNLNRSCLIWIFFCMWFSIIIILDEFLCGNISRTGIGKKIVFFLKNHWFWEFCLVYAITWVDLIWFEFFFHVTCNYYCLGWFPLLHDCVFVLSYNYDCLYCWICLIWALWLACAADTPHFHALGTSFIWFITEN